jgi:hypothetical protein
MSWWWNRDADELELRTRIARLECEIAELERLHPGRKSNVIQFPTDEPTQLHPVADGTAMEFGNQHDLMRKTNGNGGRTP